MPLISVSQVIKDILDKIKGEEEHTSYDSVVRTLLFETGHISKQEKM